MDFRETKLEWTVVVIASVLLFGVLSVFRYFQKPSQIETEAEIVYEMPRPHQSDSISDFSLADREIIRQYNNQAKNGDSTANKNFPIAAAPKKDAKKKVAKKKDSNTKKNKGSLEIDVVERDESRMSDDPLYSRPPVIVKSTEPAKEQAPEEGDEKKPAKSISEWKVQLLTQPTRKNMEAFLAAWRAGDFNADGFYQVINSLIGAKSKEAQNIALFALQAVPHLQSFMAIAHNYETLLPENQAIAFPIMMSYSQPERLNILASALKVSDIRVVKQAATAINYGLDRAKSGQGLDPRQSRGQVTALNVQSFERFVTAFQQLVQSPDSALATLANSFLSRWNS